MSRVVVFDEFGGPEVLHIVTEPAVEPAAGEVRVRIEAFAVNPLDAMMRSGSSPAPVPLPHSRLGIEATGVIDALGLDAGGLGIGDPVIITAIPDSTVRGSYAEYTTIPASAVVPRPHELDISEAAAIWVACATAYGSLVEMARIRPTDQVLVAGASGAVGRMALQIAALAGATSIALTRSAAKTGELLAAGATRVVATDREDTVEAVRRHTGGAGADIVLDLVRGPGQQDLLKAARPGGTLVAAGYLDPRPTPEPGDTPVTVLHYRGWDHLLNTEEVERTAAYLSTGVRRGALRPVIDTVFALDDVVDAHRRFDRGLHAGKKIVVTTQR
ncbi:zinc-binding dehydrogenase [Streptomyces sp. DW26H14]|uniref:zinc-binding dehydrogenase n=1 Tax=Streptomyces sp. DW26H14 TaxID=3435395 RepID=UPI00403DF8F4